MILVAILDVVALAVVSFAAYHADKDIDMVAAALLVVMLPLAGITMTAVSAHINTVPGHSTLRTSIDAVYLVAVVALTLGLARFFWGAKKYPLNHEFEPEADGSKARTTTLLNMTVGGAMIAIVAAISLVIVGPLYQRPVTNSSFITAQATEIGTLASKGAAGPPSARAVSLAAKLVKEKGAGYYDKIRRVSLSTGSTRYTVANTQDNSVACLSFSAKGYLVTRGPCTGNV